MTDSSQLPNKLLKTPLYPQHEKLGARLVDFGGWCLPVNYGSQVEEHHAVRNSCGMFDVSHMTVSDVTGADTIPFLSHLLANDINKAEEPRGKAIYSCLLNENGGVIDDLIVYRLSNQHCRLITNASTNQKDMAWISKHASEFDVDFQERPELALIALQGPDARQLCIEHCPAVLKGNSAQVLTELGRFQGDFTDEDKTHFVGRTGYTGEDGFEFVVPGETANELWQLLVENGVQACGLGARDTLRLEAGMSLYGNDLDENHTPYESGIGWSVAKDSDREFIGKTGLQEPAKQKLIGLILLDRGVLRGHQLVLEDGKEIGELTSGSFSPTLEQSIGLARVSADFTGEIGSEVEIQIRNKQLKARVARFPFVKNGEVTN